MRTLGRSLTGGPLAVLLFVVVGVWALHATRDYAVPMALAVLVWFLVNGVADALAHTPLLGRRLPRSTLQMLATGVLFLIAFGAARVIAANLADLARDLSVDGAPLLASARDLLTRFGLEAEFTKEALIERLAIEDYVGRALETARGFVSDAAMVALFTMFLLIDERFFDAKLRALQPDPARRARLEATLADVAAETRAYIWLMTVVSAGVGLLTAAGCFAAGLAGAGFWGFLAFALNYIPTIGSILAVLVPGIYAALTLGDPALLLVLVAFLGGVQFVAGEVVVPRLMGERLNLASAVILFTLVFWGAVWGPAGMFLAIPITVIAAMFFARFEPTRPVAILLSKSGDVAAPDIRHDPAAEAAADPALGVDPRPGVDPQGAPDPTDRDPTDRDPDDREAAPRPASRDEAAG